MKRKITRRLEFGVIITIIAALIYAAILFTASEYAPVVTAGSMKLTQHQTITDVTFEAHTADGTDTPAPGENILITPLIEYTDEFGVITFQETPLQEKTIFLVGSDNENISISGSSVFISPETVSGEIINIYVSIFGFDEEFQFTVKYNPANYITADNIVTDCERLDTIANKIRTLPSDFEPQNMRIPDVLFVSTFSGVGYMIDEAATAFESLVAAATADGMSIAGRTAYRSYSSQSSLFNSYASIYGETKANTFCARPGQSEHQLGLSIDICSVSNNYALGTSFAQTTEAIWVYENAYKFGYIVRYPKGKEDITGYQYEPWHLRYVGVDLATAMYNISPDLTLEEYLIR